MEKWIENVADIDYLKDNMTFISLFVAVYESMIDFVVSNVHDLLCNYRIENGKEIVTETSSYKDKIKNRVVDDKGNKDRTKASFLWFLDLSAITQDDYETFLNAKKIRNKYSHELFSYILSGVSETDVICFFKMISVYRKITNWWFSEIEVAIAGDEFPDGINTHEAQNLNNVVFDIIINVLYNDKSGEYKNMINDIKNGGKQ